MIYPTPEGLDSPSGGPLEWSHRNEERKETPMNTWKTANAVVVRHLEATSPVYDVSERGYSFIVDAPLEGDVVITPGVRTYEGGWAW